MADRDLVSFTGRTQSTVTIGTEYGFPYTFPFTFPIKGLRLVRDPDKRVLSTSTTGFRSLVTFTGRDIQDV